MSQNKRKIGLPAEARSARRTAPTVLLRFCACRSAGRLPIGACSAQHATARQKDTRDPDCESAHARPQQQQQQQQQVKGNGRMLP